MSCKALGLVHFPVYRSLTDDGSTCCLWTSLSGGRDTHNKFHEILNTFYKIGFVFGDFAQLWANVNVLSTFKVSEGKL